MTEPTTTFPFYFASWYKKSPYFQRTVEAGCTSWDLYNHMLIPTLYDDDIKEYWHLLNNVTLWDVAVERQVEITGPDAARFTQLLTPRDLSETAVGQCKYVLDLRARRRDRQRPDPAEARRGPLLAVAGRLRRAALRPGRRRRSPAWTCRSASPTCRRFSFKGPKSKQVIQKLFGDEVMNLKYYWCAQTDLDGIPVVVSRTGWTGEVGYEIYLRDGEPWPRSLGQGHGWPAPSSTSERSRRATSDAWRPASSTTATTWTSRTTRYEVTGLERLVELDNDNRVVSARSARAHRCAKE